MTDIGRRLISYLLKLVSFGLAGVAFIAMGAAIRGDVEIGLGGLIAAICVSGFAGVSAGYIYRFSNQMLSVSAEEALAGDRRPPVLYLRPFEDDALSTDLRFSDSGPFVSFTAEDEHLKAALSRIGPVILVENPDAEAALLAGGGKRYQNDEWKEGVRRDMKMAALVTMRVGSSPGLLWEFEEALKILEPRQLVLLLPYGHEYDAFRSQTRNLIQSALPPLAVAKKPAKSTIASMLYFSSCWLPVQVPLAIPPWRPETLTAALIHAMQPVYRALEIEWRPAPLSWSKLAWAAYALLIVGTLVFAIFFSNRT